MLEQLSFNHPTFWKQEVNSLDPPQKKSKNTTKRASRAHTRSEAKHISEAPASAEGAKRPLSEGQSKRLTNDVKPENKNAELLKTFSNSGKPAIGIAAEILSAPAKGRKIEAKSPGRRHRPKH